MDSMKIGMILLQYSAFIGDAKLQNMGDLTETLVKGFCNWLKKTGRAMKDSACSYSTKDISCKNTSCRDLQISYRRIRGRLTSEK